MDFNIYSDSQYLRRDKEPARGCYMFYGKNTALVEILSKKLIKNLIPQKDARDMNYHFFRGSDLNIELLGDALNALPMFAERVVAVVNDLDAEKLGKRDFDALTAAVADIDCTTTTLVIYDTAVDPCGGKKSLEVAGKKNKNYLLAEIIANNGGIVVECTQKDALTLTKVIQKQVEKCGSKIGQDAARELAQSCRCDQLMIQNEVEKLAAYRFGEEISLDDIHNLVSGQLEADAYRLAREIISGHGTALGMLDDLFRLQSEPASIISALSASFLDLYRAKLALLKGRSEADIEKNFQYGGRRFAIGNALRDCGRVPIARIRSCISVLSECDAGLKSLRTDDRVLLEKAVLRMMTDEIN